MLPFATSVDRTVLQAQLSQDLPSLQASASCTASTHRGQGKHKDQHIGLHFQPPSPVRFCGSDGSSPAFLQWGSCFSGDQSICDVWWHCLWFYNKCFCFYAPL